MHRPQPEYRHPPRVRGAWEWCQSIAVVANGTPNRAAARAANPKRAISMLYLWLAKLENEALEQSKKSLRASMATGIPSLTKTSQNEIKADQVAAARATRFGPSLCTPLADSQLDRESQRDHRTAASTG
jgi:hypothetical protein